MATILIVDDEPAVASVLAYVFKRRNYRAYTAANGAAAIALSKTHSIDVALIDVNMPGMDGFTVCRTLKADAVAHGRRLPVWMMTGAFTNVSETNAAEAGAITLVRKPFELAPLLAAIEANVPPAATTAA